MKLTKIAAATAVGVMAFASASSAMAANLINDGNFANQDAMFSTYSAGSTFGGAQGKAWTVVSGSVDQIGDYWQSPSKGLKAGSVDLDGNSPGAISQNFKPTASGNYVLNFSLSGNPDGGNAIKTVQVSIETASAKHPSLVASEIFTFDTSSISKTGMDYITETLAFGLTADTKYKLIFASLDSASPYGAVIGKVSISAVPLPAALPLFGAALMGLGALGRRRIKKTN